MNKMNFLRMNAIPGLLYSFKFERESQTPKTPCPNEKPVRFLDMELPKAKSSTAVGISGNAANMACRFSTFRISAWVLPP
jgi:hypothetical protein